MVLCFLSLSGFENHVIVVRLLFNPMMSTKFAYLVCQMSLVKNMNIFWTCVNSLCDRDVRHPTLQQPISSVQDAGGCSLGEWIITLLIVAWSITLLLHDWYMYLSSCNIRKLSLFPCCNVFILCHIISSVPVVPISPLQI